MIGSYHKILNRYLMDRSRSLKDYYESDACDLEALKSLNYDDRQEQDYNNPHIQDLYALRYMYAYAYEYRTMFQRLQEEAELPAVLNILSIGCGNGIDYWAVREAQTLELPQESPKKRFIKYTGIDLVPWKFRWGEEYLSMKADVHYETVDAAAFLRENPVLPYNIIVFPKSISEFPEDVFKTILDCFTSAKFQFKGKDGQPRNIQRVHFLVSLRIKKGVAPDELMDTKRSDRLIEAMVKNGFALENSAKVEQGAAGEICIYEQEDGFDYPMEAMNFMKKLSNEDIKIPMLHTRYVCNRIMSFVRKG